MKYMVMKADENDGILRKEDLEIVYRDVGEGIHPFYLDYWGWGAVSV